MGKLIVERSNGSTYEVEPVVSFNKGYSHFIKDDGCYLLVNGHLAPEHSKVSSWIFPEAQEVLKKLPSPRKNS